MKKMYTVLFTLLLVCWVSNVWAQSKSVSGKVTDATDGSPLPGVSVVIKGTNTGTTTDTNGSFNLATVPENASLVFSFIGFVVTEVVVGNQSTISVRLESDIKALQEVVVTAQGIQRDKKALGYAATVIQPADIAQKPESDIGRALLGRTPGLNIAASSGLVGSGTKINIRGISSVTGNTQPLFIIDGIPVNTASNEKNDFRDGNITPSRFLDIDPNNIENISVLRGLSATTLYGSQGRNGVILITTKGGAAGKGVKKYEAAVSQSYNVVQAILPEYQNEWANGFDGDYGEFFSNWGSLFANNKAVGRHPYYEHRALFPDRTELANETNYIPQAYPNNVKDFFQKGYSANTSLNVGMRTEVANFSVNISHLNEAGYIQNNNLTRTNFNIGGNAKITRKLMVTGTFNYVKTNFETPPSGAGQGSNSIGGPSVFASLFYVPRNIDLMGLPYQDPITKGSIYYRSDITNPRWLLENSRQESNTDRFFGTLSTTYDITPWLKATYRAGIDTYTESQAYWLNKGSAGYPTNDPAEILSKGIYRTTTGINTIWDHSAIISADKKLTPSLDLTANIGVNARIDTYKQEGIESTNQVVFGLISHRNFIDNNDKSFRNTQLNYVEDRTLLGAFFDATLGYKNFVYVNVQGRNDWASSHEKPYRSLFYPGVSVSFIPTAAFSGLQSSTLEFLKLRFGYGTSANFATPYNTRPYLTLNSNASVDQLGNAITLSLPLLLANPVLKPELQTEIEAGIEATLLRSRIMIDLSFYNRLAKDQIIERTLDPATGYESTFINAGEISNKGIELGLTGVPVKLGDFSWTLRANFTKNVSKVLSLPEGSKEILVDGFTDLGNFAVEGQPFGVIKGTSVKRHENGQLLVNNNGRWVIDNEVKIIADPNPDFLLTGISTFAYKGLSLGVQVDYVHGGQIFSYTAATLVGRGVSKDLEGFNPELPVILPGVDADGKPNDKPIPAAQLFFRSNIIGGGANDRGVYDATRVRLREVSLNFTVPQSWISKQRFVQGVTISANGQNLWFRTINTPKYSKVDADRTAFGTGNGSGFDFLGGPSASRYGFNIKVTF